MLAMMAASSVRSAKRCHGSCHCLSVLLETQVYGGMTSAARGIVEQHGVRGLYRGIGITLTEIVPYAALQFGLYDIFNNAYSRARVRHSLLGKAKD